MRKIIYFIKKIFSRNEENYIDEVSDKIIYMVNNNELFR